MFLQQQIEFQQQADAKRAALPCLNSNNCIDVKNTNVIKEKQKPANIENTCRTQQNLNLTNFPLHIRNPPPH